MVKGEEFIQVDIQQRKGLGEEPVQKHNAFYTTIKWLKNKKKNLY
jgi:hypothetical protein